MTEDMVTNAVRQLRAENQKITTRAVLAITGGSLRDVQRLLPKAREFLEDHEAAELDAELPEPVKPSLGRIVEAFMASQAADLQAGEASAVLDERRAELEELMARRPPPALEPEDADASVDARVEHDAKVAHLREVIGQVQGIVAAHQAQGRVWRIERNKLQQRAQELTNMIIPDRRQRLIDARNALTQLERDVEHQLMLARRAVANREQALASYEAELRGLVGE